ncbi:MAG: THUMP domain-containing class I SAM-dependent RNA methyltransferase, partial [Spirochaetota bacterium]
MSLSGRGIERRIKQHVYAKEHRFFAVVQPGFEDTARRELASCGITGEIEIAEGGLLFSAAVEQVWGLHLRSRGITRIMLRLEIFRALFWDKLREKVAAFPWELYFHSPDRIEYSISCRHSKLYHTGRIEQELCAGIAERFASVDAASEKAVSSAPTVFVRFEDDICTLTLDMTGEPLYRRGYKTHVNEAPLRETLAALILEEARCENYDIIIDPMCGSGTFPCEAAMIREGILPGAFRHFAFESMPGFSEKGYAFLKRTLAASLHDAAPARIFASDIDTRSLDACRVNAEQAGLSGKIT